MGTKELTRQDVKKLIISMGAGQVIQGLLVHIFLEVAEDNRTIRDRVLRD